VIGLLLLSVISIFVHENIDFIHSLISHGSLGSLCITFVAAARSFLLYLSLVLSGLGINQAEFVDLCILMGCDYCDTIRGIGPKTALKLIKEHKNIEAILDHINGMELKVKKGEVQKAR
jgi:hypothetical protein